MIYKLHRGYILGPGFQDYEVWIFRTKEEIASQSAWHESESEWEAELWIDREPVDGTATQADVDELNSVTTSVEPEYPTYIMEKVRQHLGLESYNTSRDAEINNMSHDSVFQHCLEWEGIIGYDIQIHGWILNIYGITLR